MERPLILCTVVLAASLAQADEFNAPPINYDTESPQNRVSRLQEKLKAGNLILAGEGRDFLKTLLKELEIPESSQMLVYSKTSLQRNKISPKTPRAIYFNDDTYVGYCHDSHVFEVSAVDPELGTVFYTIEASESGSAEIQRQGDNCLICHGGSQTRQVPGHLVRSVYTEPTGLPALSMGSHRIDHSSPLQDRWGGWYVTGTHGEQTHLGNLLVRGTKRPEEIDNAAGQNVTSLAPLFDVDQYLTPHSDLIALMVLEHQTEGHNRIVRASFQCRMALHQQQQLNKELGKPADYLWDSTKSRIRSASEELVEYLLFCEEAKLTSKLEGTSSFAQDFSQRGPRDSRGRSLRDFDLERRMFKFPCSYLVYTEAFDALPEPVKEHVWRRIWEVVTGEDNSEKFAHLSADDRLAIKEILLETKKELPADWKVQQ